MTVLRAEPLSADAFAPFGEVIETGGPCTIINDGHCCRYTDLATFDMIGGRPGLSLFHAQIRTLPYDCTLLERHPLGAQCFIPMQGARFLIIVAPDDGGVPGTPRAFVAEDHQSVNIARNTWHGVLCPIAGSGLFAVIDRIGDGNNLEEHHQSRPIRVTA